MNSRGSLKKLIIDITIPVMIFSFVIGALFFSQRGYQLGSNFQESDFLDEDAWYAVRNEKAGSVSSTAPRCLLVFDGNDETSITLKDNIAYVLKSINVSSKTAEIYIPDDEEFDDAEYIGQEISLPQNRYDFAGFDDVIFCISNLSYLGVSPTELENWVSNGGHVMFAMGLEQTSGLSHWSSILGISNDTLPEITVADSLKFKTNILVGVEDKEFSDDIINCPSLDVSLGSDCVLHLTTCDEEELPLLWERNIGNGKVMVSNADLFETKSDRGLFTAAYCQFYPVFAYPVINSAVYCIDDCPAPAPAGYDDNVREQYGYTVSDFISNVWMPSMQNIAEEYGVKFTTFVIQSYDDNVEGPFNNQDHIKSAKYYAALIANMGGEIGIHGYNHQPLVLEGFSYDKENAGYKQWPNTKKMIESIDTVIKYTQSLTDDLYVQAYIAPSNVISEEALVALQNHFEDLRIYAGVYLGSNDQMVQEFEVLENGIVYCPRLTADMQMEDSEWWMQINELNYHYITSNFIHPDDILDEERSDGGDFSQMLSSYKEMIEWNHRYGLRTNTISECGAAVQRYCNLNFSQKYENDKLTIKVDGLIDSAYMMLRLNGKKPTQMEGGSYTKLNDNVYILKIDKENVSLKLV
jgi:hypothetical protein